MLHTNLLDEPVALLPERAMWHPPSRTLFAADLHLGKSSAFRAAGIPVPDTTLRTLARLTDCIARSQPERLVILGDLLHAPSGRTPYVIDAVTAWRASVSQLSITLIRGNHDASSGDPPAEWHIDVLAGPLIDPFVPFVLAHEPGELTRGRFGLCGHLHPTFPLAAFAGFHTPAARSVPCMWITPSHAVLPAFGDFTGGRRALAGAGDRLVLFIGDEIFEMPRRFRQC